MVHSTVLGEYDHLFANNVLTMHLASLNSQWISLSNDIN